MPKRFYITYGCSPHEYGGCGNKVWLTHVPVKGSQRSLLKTAADILSHPAENYVRDQQLNYWDVMHSYQCLCSIGTSAASETTFRDWAIDNQIRFNH